MVNYSLPVTQVKRSPTSRRLWSKRRNVRLLRYTIVRRHYLLGPCVSVKTKQGEEVKGSTEEVDYITDHLPWILSILRIYPYLFNICPTSFVVRQKDYRRKISPRSKKINIPTKYQPFTVLLYLPGTLFVEIVDVVEFVKGLIRVGTLTTPDNQYHLFHSP